MSLVGQRPAVNFAALDKQEPWRRIRVRKWTAAGTAALMREFTSVDTYLHGGHSRSEMGTLDEVMSGPLTAPRE